MKRLFATALASCILIGCASGYSQFYTPLPGATVEAVDRMRAQPFSGTPAVERIGRTDPRQLSVELGKRGYRVIGYSEYNGGAGDSDKGAIEQGKKVRADLVVISSPLYTGSISTAMPISTPTTTTAYSSGTATAYGPGGTVRAYGSGTTTTYGSQTTYIPIVTHRTDYQAIYAVKIRVLFGAIPREMTDAERRAVGTNSAAAVDYVITGSPAYRADIFGGDIVTALDGVPITAPEVWGQITDRSAGKTIAVDLYRDGQRLQKTVQLNPLN